jgi:uncharacterized protein YpuA (DUF1002 family)
MQDLQAMLEEAIRSGKTLKDLYGMANAAQNTIVTEQEREDKVAAARKKAAEAMCEYMNVLEPKSNMSIEEAYALMEELEEMYDLSVPETEPIVKVYTGDEAKAKAESLVGDFESFIKSLGF